MPATTKAGELLFKLPIASSNGNVVCTLPATRVYLVTFTSGADNRLTTVCLRSRSIGVEVL